MGTTAAGGALTLVGLALVLMGVAVATRALVEAILAWAALALMGALVLTY